MRTSAAGGTNSSPCWWRAQRSAKSCEEYGYQILGWPGIFLRALLAAVRGDVACAEELSDDMTRWAKPRGAGAILAYASHVRALLALGQGQYDLAYRHVAAIDPPGMLTAHAPRVLWVVNDVVESAIRSGHLADAERHVDALIRARAADISPRLALVTRAAAAMTGPDDMKRTLFTRVLHDPDVGRLPFEHARILLNYGEHLRRARATREARPCLEQAREGFRVLGARPWVEKESAELRAAGASRTGAPAGQVVPLTPQQLEIAQLAAQGLTNKQIGERLFLSHGTVATHLYQLYPKLGVSSRASLRDALEAIGEASEPAGPGPPAPGPRERRPVR
jgi:ATP/maltotriose-dependent transcriptional regulator MalT